MFIHQRFVPGLAIASYIVGDEKAREAAVIDATRDVDEYQRIAAAEGLAITHILETHVHADFVSGACELKAKLDRRPKICCSSMGGPEWTPRYADVKVTDGTEIALGTLRLRAMHTPGHTPEHICWALFDQTRSPETPWLIFTGDFLFVGDVGRPDLLGEAQRQQLASSLYESVFKRMQTVPEYTEIAPGHGAGSLCGKAIGSRRWSSVGFERRFNVSLQPMPQPQWIARLLSDMPAAPPYFARMKQINVQGPAILGTSPPGRRALAAAECRKLVDAGATVLDVRPPEAFSAAHVPGAINIGIGANLANWAGWMVDYDRPIVLVLDSPSSSEQVSTALLRIGLDRIEGYLDGGMNAWETHGYPLGRSTAISVRELADRMSNQRDLRLLDVRSVNEWKSGHINGAISLPLTELPQRLDDVPRDRPLAVVCGGSYRSSIAVSYLLRHGFASPANVLGGMAAWHAAGLATEC